MRIGIWLYLDLLARLGAGEDSIEFHPAGVAHDMGVPEGTIRSWLGHLRKGGYVAVERLNGALRATIHRDHIPTPDVHPRTVPDRLFTTTKLARALGKSGEEEALQGVIGHYPDDVIRRALAGALSVPQERIRRSRTALFIYLLKRHAKET